MIVVIPVSLLSVYTPALPIRAQVLPLPARHTCKPVQTVELSTIQGGDAPVAIWVHLDFCKLHGGGRLGSCRAGLRMTRWGVHAVHLEAMHDSDVLVMTHAADCPEGSKADAAAQTNDDTTVGSAADGLVGLDGHGISGLQERSTSVVEQLTQLANQENVMVDLALFDAQGRLLLGR